MKLINPAGNAMTPDGNTIQPRACMCSSKKNFANAKGSDGCFHCGCSCSDNTVNSGNNSSAFWTIRSITQNLLNCELSTRIFMNL